MSAPWPTLPFDEAVQDASGGNIKTKQNDYAEAGEFPIVDQGKALIAGYTDDEAALCKAQLPVVIFGDHTRCLKFVDFPFGMGADGVKVLKPKAGLDAKFLYHYLRQIKLPDGGYDRHFKYLKRETVPLPPLEEQRRIAAILDQAETLRTQRRTALALLDSLTQSLFLDMFGDPATNSRKWPVKRLKDLGQVITGGTPPSSKEGMFDGPIPFITPGDLESEEPVRRSVTEAGAKEVNVVRAGATLVCCIGATIGKVGIAQKDSAFNQQLNAVVWGNHISDNYGYEVMRFFKPTIISWGASTTLPILKKSSFEQIEIPVPPVPLQELFTDRLKHISNLKGLYKSALLGFDNLFNALQSRAFAGEP